MGFKSVVSFLSVFYNFVGMSKGKNQLVHLHMPVILYDMIARESFQTSTSKQEIVRQIIRAHFSKKYGKDVFLEREEIKL